MFKKLGIFSKQDGPPDLDEVLKDLGRKIDNIFKRKPRIVVDNNGGGANNNGNKQNINGGDIPLLPILLIVFLIWLLTGFYIVDQGSRGVVLRFGEHIDITQPGPRWHLPYPIETVEIVNQEQVRTIEVGYRSSNDLGANSQDLRESLMLTGDENIVDLQFAVQYNLKSVEDFIFNNRAAESSVRAGAETAIREVVGKSEMDFVLYEGREEIAIRTKDLIQQILDRYSTGINVTSVTMQNAQPPEQVQAAFDDAVKAKQDLERQKNEGQAYANDVVPKARGTAARLLAEANGYKVSIENEALGNSSRFEQIMKEYERAPEVTKNRLFLEAQEEILSNVTKVIIDQKSGSNSLIYLPLDQIMKNNNRSSVNSVLNSSPNNIELPKTESTSIDVTQERSRDAFRAREREMR
ncbi:MAG: FtsH protease activity modulator HflK [Betaproteobacteria bacterium]|jgi:membrane protease subunit HflK|nr:FtsH protease activity modulator HflK [Nitrosomonadales bacterium]NCV38440.1 FtsH protease activity modulator HflK [Betaproteobacteria bacterium]NCV53490.1 FtsH protease activity modulator HflK [Betaproteobacteria bacterium]NCW62978.1 FtsH protease activity modulator HflK [Betaproteobacteria bacterium]NCX67578.1 FtsH protease activity modulator HflK [Betaproteobacteria bacterium]